MQVSAIRLAFRAVCFGRANYGTRAKKEMGRARRGKDTLEVQDNPFARKGRGPWLAPLGVKKSSLHWSELNWNNRTINGNSLGKWTLVKPHTDLFIYSNVVIICSCYTRRGFVGKEILTLQFLHARTFTVALITDSVYWENYEFRDLEPYGISSLVRFSQWSRSHWRKLTMVNSSLPWLTAPQVWPPIFSLPW